eukprot:SAG22_NODE_396_length_11127_cov_33.460011_2_plen_170_part_00
MGAAGGRARPAAAIAIVAAELQLLPNEEPAPHPRLLFAAAAAAVMQVVGDRAAIAAALTGRGAALIRGCVRPDACAAALEAVVAHQVAADERCAGGAEPPGECQLRPATHTHTHTHTHHARLTGARRRRCLQSYGSRSGTQRGMTCCSRSTSPACRMPCARCSTPWPRP